MAEVKKIMLWKCSFKRYYSRRYAGIRFMKLKNGYQKMSVINRKLANLDACADYETLTLYEDWLRELGDSCK